MLTYHIITLSKRGHQTNKKEIKRGRDKNFHNFLRQFFIIQGFLKIRLTSLKLNIWNLLFTQWGVAFSRSLEEAFPPPPLFILLGPLSYPRGTITSNHSFKSFHKQFQNHLAIVNIIEEYLKIYHVFYSIIPDFSNFQKNLASL